MLTTAFVRSEELEQNLELDFIAHFGCERIAHGNDFQALSHHFVIAGAVTVHRQKQLGEFFILHLLIQHGLAVSGDDGRPAACQRHLGIIGQPVLIGCERQGL